MVEYVPDGSPLAGTDADHSENDEFGIYEEGEAFVDDCNVCVKGKYGITCTAQACGVDNRAVASCGGKQQGAVWANDCNLCTCTAEGEACTLGACTEPNNY